MPLESDYKELNDAFRRMNIAYVGLTQRQIKNKSIELRKELKKIMDISLEMRKSTQTFKDSMESKRR